MGELPIEQVTPGPVFEKIGCGLCWSNTHQAWTCTETNHCEIVHLCVCLADH